MRRLMATRKIPSRLSLAVSDSAILAGSDGSMMLID